MIRLYRFLLSTKEEINDLYRNSLLKPYTNRSTMEYIDEFYGMDSGAGEWPEAQYS